MKQQQSLQFMLHSPSFATGPPCSRWERRVECSGLPAGSPLGPSHLILFRLFGGDLLLDLLNHCSLGLHSLIIRAGDVCLLGLGQWRQLLLLHQVKPSLFTVQALGSKQRLWKSLISGFSSVFANLPYSKPMREQSLLFRKRPADAAGMQQ